MRSEFADEALRRSVADQLNTLPGVRIPEDRLGKRPSISYQLLRDPAVLDGFLAAMD